MNRAILLATPAFLSVLLFLFTPSDALAVDASWLGAEVTDSDSLLIQVKSGQNLSHIEPLLLQEGLSVARSWPEFDLAEVRVGADRSTVAGAAAEADYLATTIKTLSTVPGIVQVGADLRIYAADRGAAPIQANANASVGGLQSPDAVAPNDPLYEEQWAHYRMNVAAGWQINRGNPDLAVAVIDSGYDLGHDDLSGESLWVNDAERNGLPGVDDDRNGFVDDYHGWDWIENDDTANDPYGHGTHVGGVIAASTDNRIGIAGLGLDLKILPLRVLDEQGSGQISDLIDALYYAHMKGIRVANLSLVLQFESSMLEVAVREAHAGGMVIIAASGNNATGVYWPAKFEEAIAVAATDMDDQRGLFSNYGPEIDVGAPGVDILSTYRDSAYSRLNGTSMATAQVSALAGLVLSLRPDLPTEQVRDLIRNSAVDVNRALYPGVDDFLGHGRIDYLAALSMASQQLAIRPADEAGVTLFSGESALVAARVESLSTSSPAAGAVVHYELIQHESASDDAADHAQRILAGQSISDIDGEAHVAFSAPAPGEYVLRLSVGLMTVDVPTIVHSGATAVQLVMPHDETMAGSPPLPLAIEILDASGHLMPDETSISLTTNLGRFPNGRQEYETRVNGGRTEVLLTVGEKVGTANVSARVGQVSATSALRVTPGPPASIEAREAVKPIANWAGPGETSICLAVVDQFGNAVSDGTLVQMFTDRGTLTRNTLTSEDGSVATTLVVQKGVDGVAHIWAVASGTNVHVQVDVPVMGHAAWVPILYAD